MSEPIKAGDFVMVVRPTLCCGVSRKYGYTFTVTLMNSSPTGCNDCGAVTTYLSALAPLGTWVEVARLKRIPPMSQLEHFRSQELLRRDLKEKA